ncbi:MAG: response regulator transcription factor [Clostridium sp.]|jgi:NarL family two-component system response regulator LiaR|nr:response regulator transcription factor [Clostridium sp.]
MIKVIVVDDEQNWLIAISKLLNKEDDISVVGTANNKESVINLIKENLSFDVILMDISLSSNKYDGIETALEIKELKEDAKIIMLTSFENRELIIDSFTAGADKYVKKTDYTTIADEIREVYNGKSSYKAYKLLIDDFNKLKKQEQLKDLTNAEKDLFELLEKGYSRSEIQEKLIKTENTIKTQIKNILKKLGVKNTKEAVRKVQTRGILKKDKYKSNNE